MNALRRMSRPFATVIALVLGAGVDVFASEVVTVVSARNPVATLTKTQAADIFLARVSRFPDGRKAVAIDQIEGSPERAEFYAEFAQKSPAQLKAYWSKIIFTGRGQPPVAVPNSAEVKKRLAANPNAIGYIARNAVDSSVRVVDAD